MDPLASPPPLSRSLPSAIPGPGAQGRSPGTHPAQRCAWGPCTHGVIPQELGGEAAERGGKEQGDRSGCAHLTCLPQGTFPESLSQATQHCTAELSPNSRFAGQLGGVTQHLSATPRPQPPHSGGYSTNACHSLTWERCIFSKPQVNQSETELLPILNLYGGFLPELACARTH